MYIADIVIVHGARFDCVLCGCAVGGGGGVGVRGEGVLARNGMSYRPSFGVGMQETHQSVSSQAWVTLINCGWEPAPITAYQPQH